MPACGEGPEYDTKRRSGCGAGHLSGCTKLGLIEDCPPEAPSRECSDEYCPIYCDPNDPTGGHPGGPAHLRPWTYDYLAFCGLEKLHQLYYFLTVTLYGNNYYWSLFKAITVFAYGIKVFFQLSRKFQEDCERRKRCQEFKKKYGR